MYVVRRLAQRFSIYESWVFRSAAVSRIHTPFILSASTDVSSANLVGTENDQRLGDTVGLRRRDDSGRGGRGQKVSTSNERESFIGGRGEAWWKARVLEENAPKKGSRVGSRRTRRYVSLHSPR